MTSRFSIQLLSLGVCVGCFTQLALAKSYEISPDIIIETKTNSKGIFKTQRILPEKAIRTEPAVKGYSYIYDTYLHFPKGIDCDTIFEQVNSTILSSLYYNHGFFGTSFMHCQTDQQGNPIELYVQAMIEPATLANIPMMDDYLKKVQGKALGDSQVQFIPVKEVISRFDLQALTIDQLNVDMILHWHASTYRIFHSLREDFDFHAEIRTQFWTPVDDFLSMVQKYFGDTQKQYFYIFMHKSNGVIGEYERAFIVEEGRTIDNYLWNPSPYRNCKDNPNHQCI